MSIFLPQTPHNLVLLPCPLALLSSRNAILSRHLAQTINRCHRCLPQPRILTNSYNLAIPLHSIAISLCYTLSLYHRLDVPPITTHSLIHFHSLLIPTNLAPIVLSKTLLFLLHHNPVASMITS